MQIEAERHERFPVLIQSMGETRNAASWREMMVASAATDEIRERIHDLLRERFRDELEFGPIVVMPRIDDEGTEYLKSYIVFHGDQSILDPEWTMGLSGSLWEHAVLLGYPGMPIQHFVENSEWPALEGLLSESR